MGFFDDIKQAFDNCKNMDGRNPPDKYNPTSNTTVLSYVKPCTMYNLDEDTLQPDISSLMFPNDRKNQLYGDSFTIPDYCSPNVAIFGTNFSTGYQTSFIDDYCKNVTRPSIQTSSPQDIIVKAYLPEAQPEWLSTKEATYVNQVVSNANIQSQIFSLANTGKISYSTISNPNASDISGEKPINVSNSPNQDIALAQAQSNADATNEIATGITDTGLASTVLATTVAASSFAAEASFAAELGPLALEVGAVVLAAGFITDIIKEDDCYYNDAKVPTKVGGFGCCRGQCAIRGKGGSCQRNIFGYKADVFQCCLQDFYCPTLNGKALSDGNNNAKSIDTQTLNLCYQQKGDRTYACDPHYRGMTQPFCKEMMFAFCTGQVPYASNQSSLLQAWVPGADPIDINGFEISTPCLNFLARLLVDTPGTCTWDDFVKNHSSIFKTDIRSENFLMAQNLLDQVLQTYLKTHGNPVQSINTDGYYENSQFIEWYFNFCQKYPILCQDALRDNFCSDYNLNDLADNPALANWCGCYLNKEEYKQYTQYDVDINCTPTCNRANTIPITNDITGVPEPCTQNVCIMDDIAIRLLNTESSGNISFTQACHSCGQNKISSIIDSQNITDTVQNSNNVSTSYVIIPPSDIQATVVIPQNVQYPGGTTSQLLQPRIGLRLVPYGVNYAPQQGPVSIIRLDTGQTGLANFTTTSTPAEGGNNFSITGFSQTPSIFLDDISGKANVPSGTLIVISQVLIPNENTFAYFQVVSNNSNSQLNIQSKQTIGSFVSQFNLGRDVNECRCVFHDTTISFVESRLKGANFSQNCGQTETNINGKTAPNSISLNNKFSVQDSISSSITSTQDFVEVINLDKTKFTITVLAVVTFMLVVMQYTLTQYPRSYGKIIMGTFLLIIVAIVFIYLWYSFEVNWGLDEDIWSTLQAAL